jgi:hypothetical protein
MLIAFAFASTDTALTLLLDMYGGAGANTS